MGTKSDRSSGTQFTPRGINQGTVLVDPKTGNPINTVSGKLDVNASVTATIGDVEIHAVTSSVRIEDPTTGAHVRVETDGSINANIHTSAFAGTPDSELIVGTEDGTTGGTKHVAKIDSNNNLNTINMGQLVPKVFDSIVATYPLTTQEVYTYKTGGVGGATVATVTVNYSDSTKNTITSVSRT